MPVRPTPPIPGGSAPIPPPGMPGPMLPVGPMLPAGPTPIPPTGAPMPCVRAFCMARARASACARACAYAASDAPPALAPGAKAPGPGPIAPRCMPRGFQVAFVVSSSNPTPAWSSMMGPRKSSMPDAPTLSSDA